MEDKINIENENIKNIENMNIESNDNNKETIVDEKINQNSEIIKEENKNLDINDKETLNSSENNKSEVANKEFENISSNEDSNSNINKSENQNILFDNKEIKNESNKDSINESKNDNQAKDKENNNSINSKEEIKEDLKNEEQANDINEEQEQENKNTMKEDENVLPNLEEKETVISHNDKININKKTDLELEEKVSRKSSAASGSELSSNEIESLYIRTKENKSMSLDKFFTQKRHYFIMTEGGTPIYSRYGDEIKHCSILATFSAIITKFTVFNNDKNFGERLNYICNDNTLIVFLKKGKIIFIALSNKQDTVSFLYKQLELLYHQLLSIITSERMPALEEKPSTCARILTGTNEYFEQIIEYTTHSLVGLLSSYQVLPIENRNKLNDICSKNRGQALLCCLMTSNAKEIIAMSKSDLINLCYSDMVLIQCLIMSSLSLRSQESWVPICLPGISAEGFLQLYCNFNSMAADRYGIIFITENQDQKCFVEFQDLCKNIVNEIYEKGVVNYIDRAIDLQRKADVDVDNKNKNEVDPEKLKAKLMQLFNRSNENINDKNQDKLNNLNNDKKINNNLEEQNKLTNNNNNDVNSNNSNNNQIKKENKKPDIINNNINYSNEINIKREVILKSKSEYLAEGIISSEHISTLNSNTYKVVPGKIEPFTKMKYCYVKNKLLNQFFTINFHNYEHLTKEEKYVMKTYIKLFDMYNSISTALINPDNFFQIEKDSLYSHIIYANDSYVILCTFNLFKKNDEIIERVKEAAKQIKNNEGNFFVLFK